MELLAPAGSVEALQAAVQNGADAVYLGYGNFNARRSAKNFSQEALAAAVSYCHLRGVKLYLTLNTLLTDRELPEALAVAELASTIGVDAVLVQDLGLLRLLRNQLPDLPLHASTQMSIHNLAGTRFCHAEGLQRVVLARETSGENLRSVCAASTLEIECFVHGALCVSHSGQCYFSALLGGRSGNRGLCAQPCRLAYRVRGEGAPAYPLSLKDLSLAAQLEDLREMGIACVKLEGRMKRPEYVALVTGVFSAALREGRRPTEEEEALLREVFSRDGFTQGYFTQTLDQSMFGRRREGAAPPEALYAKARESYEGAERRCVPLRLSVEIRWGQPARLQLRDAEGREAEVFEAVPEAARQKALTEELIRRQLTKTGGTVFSCEDLRITLDEGLSLPLSALNALRRAGFSAMEALRCAPPARRSIPWTAPKLPPKRQQGAPAISLLLRSVDQLSEALLEAAPGRIWLPLEALTRAGTQLADWQAAAPGTRFGVQLPRVVFDSEWDKLLEELARCRTLGIRDALLGNWGQIEAAAQLGFALHGDHGLGLFNRETASALQALGFQSATPSFELNFAQIADLRAPLPLSLIAYGRLPLMLLEHDLTDQSPLLDRKGEAFPLLPHWGGRSELYNAKTLWLADLRAQWPPVEELRLLFDAQSAEECAAVLRAYQGAGEPAPPEDFTRGLYFRKVE